MGHVAYRWIRLDIWTQWYYFEAFILPVYASHFFSWFWAAFNSVTSENPAWPGPPLFKTFLRLWFVYIFSLFSHTHVFTFQCNAVWCCKHVVDLFVISWASFDLFTSFWSILLNLLFYHRFPIFMAAYFMKVRHIMHILVVLLWMILFKCLCLFWRYFLFALCQYLLFF